MISTLMQLGWPLAQADGGFWKLMIGLLVAMFLFMLITGRGRRKEQQAREKMLADLARNDKVVTIGGIMGVVADVKEDEIVLKVDEANNTKIRMKKWAVRALDAKEAGPAAQEKK